MSKIRTQLISYIKKLLFDYVFIPCVIVLIHVNIMILKIVEIKIIE